MKYLFSLAAVLVVLSLTACGGDKAPKAEAQKAQSSNPGGLTDFQMENGIGPITEKIVLGDIDMAKVKVGEEMFKGKCAPCHKLDKRFVGPALRYVTERRTPEYILNMILNPDQMVKEHPEARKMLGEYLSPMTNMNLTVDQAKDLLEYMRFVDVEGIEKNIKADPPYRNQK